MVAAGFAKEMTYANQTTSSPGEFNLWTVGMGDVSPAGATVVVALVAWNTSDPTWSAMLASANQATRAGVAAFLQPTVTPSLLGAPLPALAMSQDLVLPAIPEPSALALAGLGGALLLLLRAAG